MMKTAESGRRGVVRDAAQVQGLHHRGPQVPPRLRGRQQARLLRQLGADKAEAANRPAQGTVYFDIT